MKKFRKLLALVVLVMLIVTSTVSGVASTTLTDAQLLQQYAVNFVKRVEHIGNIEVDWTMEMHDLANDNPIAQYISLNPTGYIIVGVNPPTVYEYSLSDQLMNTRSTKEVILSGPFSYYTKEGNDYIHLKTNEHFSKSQLSNGAIDFQNFISSNQSSEPTEVLKKKVATLEMSTFRGSIDEKVLRNSLTSSYLNSIDGVGCCGPDAAYAVFQYMGKLRSSAADYKDEIKYISTLTGVATTLSNMKKGMQDYLKNNSISGTVYSMNYSFPKVKEYITANKPITLGTNGGGLSTGGHIQTIYGYYHEVISSRNQIYILKIHSWGKSAYSITYEINPNTSYPPTYLKDHIYVN